MSVFDVDGDGEEAAFSPFDLVALTSAAEGGVSAPGDHVGELLVEVLGGRKGFAGRNLLDHGVHVDVAGKIQVQAAAAGLRPRLHFLPGGVKNGVAFDHRQLAVLDPLPVEIAFDAAAAANVGGAELGLLG